MKKMFLIVVLLAGLLAGQLVAQSVTITPNASSVCLGTVSSVNLTATPTGDIATNYQWLDDDNLTISNGLIDFISVSPPTTPGTCTYTVIVSWLGGGTDTSTATVTVNPQPTTPTITPGVTTTICEGTSLALNSSSAASYQWQRNGSMISGSNVQVYDASTSGDYKVRITDVNGCNSAWSLATTVNVIPLPVANVTTDDPEACYPNTVTLTADPVEGASYQWWYSPSGLSGTWGPESGSTNVIQGTTSGRYGVEVTIGSCTNRSFVW